jgi:AbrB family looped-hinge helix DNA binding protein
MKRETKTETEEAVEAVFRGQSKMTARGQITVPTEVRRKFGLRPGDILCFLEIEGTVILKLGPLVLTE